MGATKKYAERFAQDELELQRLINTPARDLVGSESFKDAFYSDKLSLFLDDWNRDIDNQKPKG